MCPDGGGGSGGSQNDPFISKRLARPLLMEPLGIRRCYQSRKTTTTATATAMAMAMEGRRTDMTTTGLRRGWYRTLRRVVSSSPWSDPFFDADCFDSDNDQDGDCEASSSSSSSSSFMTGEVEAVLEEYYPPVVSQSSSSSSLGCASACTNSAPLFRRVAVRAFGSKEEEEEEEEEGGGSGGKKRGRLHASYELPPLALTTVRFRSDDHYKEGGTKEDGDGGRRRAEAVRREEDGEAIDSILCWASFRGGPVTRRRPMRRQRQRRLGRRRRRQTSQRRWNGAGGSDDDDDDDNDNDDGGGRAYHRRLRRRRGSSSRKMLCVLAGPSLLRVFDVYPPSFSSEEDDSALGGGGGSAGGGDGGEGYSIPLPFDARSIHPLPLGGGVLIQRAPTAEESGKGVVHDAGAGGGEGGGGGGSGGMIMTMTTLVPPSGLEGVDGNVAAAGFDDVNRGGSGGGSGDDDQDDDDDEGEVLRDPPNPIRLRSTPLLMPVATAAAAAYADDYGHAMAAAAAAAATKEEEMEEVDDEGKRFYEDGFLAPPSPLPYAIAGAGLIDGSPPSLFTLSHPLDEVRPVAASPTSSASCQLQPPTLSPPARRLLPPPVPALADGFDDDDDDNDDDDDEVDDEVKDHYRRRRRRRPRAESPTGRSSRRGGKGGDPSARAVPSAAATSAAEVASIPAFPFADAAERVVFVGGPRIFAMPPPSCSLDDGDGGCVGAGVGGRNETKEDECDDFEKEEEENEEGEEEGFLERPVVMVTYHERLHRHAVWSLRVAPPPPPPLPLWKRTAVASRMKSSASNGLVNGDGGVGSDDDNDNDNNNNDNNDAPISPLRDDDAFGGHGLRGKVREETATGTDAWNLVGDDYNDDSPFGNIHPDWKLALLYAETPPARNTMGFAHDVDRSALAAFLATDAAGTGDLVLCLLCPAHCDGRSRRDDKGGPDGDNVLRMILLHAAYAGQGPSVIIDSATRLPRTSDVRCRSARPIQSSPMPPPPRLLDHRRRLRLWTTGNVGGCWNARSVTRKARDVLVCTASGILRLYRADVAVVSCAFPPGNPGGNIELCSSPGSEFSSGRAWGLANAVSDRIDIFCDADESEGGEGGMRRRRSVIVRAALSLVMSSLSPVAEAALAAVESSLCYSSIREANHLKSKFGLLVRSDCVRLSQALSLPVTSSEPPQEDPGWVAVEKIMASIFDAALSSLSIGTDNSHGYDSDLLSEDGATIGTNVPVSPWEELLQSDFHSRYLFEEGSSLLLERTPLHGVEDRRRRLHSRKHVDAAQSALERLIPSSLACFSQINESLSKETTNLSAHVPPGTGLPFPSCIARAIFDSLHLLYEDCKLSRNARGMAWMRSLGNLLVRLCARVGFAETSPAGRGGREVNMVMGDFVDHYNRDLGFGLLESLRDIEDDSSHAFDKTIFLKRKVSVTSFSVPPCIFSWMSGVMQGYEFPLQEGSTSGTYSGTSNFFYRLTSEELNGACFLTGIIHRLFSILFAEEADTANREGELGLISPDDNGMDIDDLNGKSTLLEGSKARDRSLIIAMIQEGIRHPSILLDEFPTGVALPLMEALHRCRSDPPPESSIDHTCWPPEAYILIDRNDIAETYRLKNLSPSSSPHSGAWAQTHQMNDDPDRDGLVSLSSISSMLFPDDNRVSEAARLLRSSRPIFLRVPRAPEVTDHDYERLKQERLLLLSRRALALPLGRGMATFGTLPPTTVTSAAEPLPMPDLCLSGRVPPTNATLALDVSGCAADMSVWPEFHNGVASGLRLPMAGTGHQNDNLRQITRTWIVYNKPTLSSSSRQNSSGHGEGTSDGSERPNHAHGGLLMALGMRGHLAALAMTDIYDYLTQGAVTTTVGILLGMAANKRGTCDPSVSKMLCLHLPSLLPPTFAAMDVASTAQCAAVAGIGLLYQNSSHRLMTEFLLNELGKRPSTDQNTQDRQGYTLCCGLALGMVNLSPGKSLSSSPKGGLHPADDGFGLSDLRIEERLHRYIVGGLDDADLKHRREASERATASASANLAEQERCSCIHEGETINTDVTAPGATLALALMYLQTGNKSVASQLSLPDTLFLLDYVRPDLLMLRVIARALILWDDVKPTQGWIENQVPPVLAKRFDQLGRKAQKISGLGGFASFVSMELDSGSSAESPTSNPADMAKDTSRYPQRKGKADTNILDDFDFDRQAVRQARAYVVAGACFGMGLRYAGTGNSDAAAALHKQVTFFARLRDESDLVSLSQRPEMQILEMCLGCTALALAMVMAGTGDLETFRLLRALRWRCEEAVRYGTHMAFSAAIGLLFLGGGTCTLGREPDDIAALLLAFFPRFPSVTSDNQYHLQALRHCYALAVKNRQLEAIDIDTRERVFVPVEISFNNEQMKLTAPFLLLDRGNYSHLKVDSSRYYPSTLDLQSSSYILFVKKKSGHLSYQHDPHAQRSLPVQTGGVSRGSALDLIQSFTEDPRLLAYAKFLCQSTKRTHKLKGGNAKTSASASLGEGLSVEEFCTDILHECLTKNKPEALSLYLSLRNSLASIRVTEFRSAGVWNILLVRSYYRGRYKSVGFDTVPLLEPDFVAFLEEYVDMEFERGGLNGETVISYVNSHGNWVGKDWPCLFGAFLIWHQVPNPYALNASLGN